MSYEDENERIEKRLMEIVTMEEVAGSHGTYDLKIDGQWIDCNGNLVEAHNWVMNIRAVFRREIQLARRELLADVANELAKRAKL